MIELVIFMIVLNILFEIIQMLCPMDKLSGLTHSCLMIIEIYLIILKLKNFF